MPNIKDVAKRAGVSVTAVSRALNNYPDIKPETKARILRIAEELHYYPKASARHLVTQRSNTIGVFYPNRGGPGLGQPFIADLLNAFKNTIGDHGYDLLLFSNTQAPFDTINVVDRVKHRDVDGVLVLSQPDEAVDELIHAGVPLVGVDHLLDGPRMGSVRSDNRQSVQAAVKRLYHRGYRTFGFVHAETVLSASSERLQGYLDGMQAIGLTPNPDWIVGGRFDMESGRQAARTYLHMGNRPEIILCAADIIAIGMIQVFQHEGIRIPDDISLVGFDDIEAASYVYPQLTTVRQNTEAMGKLAARTLVRLIDDETLTAPQHHVLPTEWVERQTTRPLI